VATSTSTTSGEAISSGVLVSASLGRESAGASSLPEPEVRLTLASSTTTVSQLPGTTFQHNLVNLGTGQSADRTGEDVDQFWPWLWDTAQPENTRLQQSRARLNPSGPSQLGPRLEQDVILFRQGHAASAVYQRDFASAVDAVFAGDEDPGRMNFFEDAGPQQDSAGRFGDLPRSAPPLLAWASLVAAGHCLVEPRRRNERRRGPAL
jgi:hypothetical protein